MKILVVLSLLFCFSPASPAFAKNINVLRNFPLSSEGEGYFGMYLYFEEANPGRVSENVLANGCGLLVRSRGNYLLSGRYKVGYEEETRPTLGDRRWRKQYTNWAPGSDMRVSCKSKKRISDDYIRKVMGGYVRIER